eukprot:3240103-Ditylum_brightwellii.AAC.1
MNPIQVYYFEVTVFSGLCSVGLVPAKSVVAPEYAHLIGNQSAASAPHPFPVILNQMPGQTPNSIGLNAD